MPTASTATYSLLGLLALRPWTGYELTRQARRSLRFAWPSSEAHLYREQKRLVALGWASLDKENVGQRTRNAYSITPAGRAALKEWLKTEPAPPKLEIEGLLRAFFGDHGEPEDLARSLRATSTASREMADDLISYAEEYLETGGPFPERLHVIALTAELFVDLLSQIGDYCDKAADEVGNWDSTKDRGMTDEARTRFERMIAHRR